MVNISENIAKNITKLRKINKLTQLDFANKLNLTDKAVSKWEREESLPDIETLYSVAKFFNVGVGYLCEYHSDEEIAKSQNKKAPFIRNLLILILASLSILLISTTVFVYATLKNPSLAKDYWVSFVCAVPFISLFCTIYGTKYNYWLMKLISESLIIWSIITVVFCFAIVIGSDGFWLLYLIGIPLQGIICLINFTKKVY